MTYTILPYFDSDLAAHGRKQRRVKVGLGDWSEWEDVTTTELSASDVAYLTSRLFDQLDTLGTCSVQQEFRTIIEG